MDGCGGGGGKRMEGKQAADRRKTREAMLRKRPKSNRYRIGLHLYGQLVA
jgi:hypothetical protein